MDQRSCGFGLGPLTCIRVRFCKVIAHDGATVYTVMATGEIEITVHDLTVQSMAEQLPILVDGKEKGYTLAYRVNLVNAGEFYSWSSGKYYLGDFDGNGPESTSSSRALPRLRGRRFQFWDRHSGNPGRHSGAGNGRRRPPCDSFLFGRGMITLPWHGLCGRMLTLLQVRSNRPKDTP
jgi:hypothetical protein